MRPLDGDPDNDVSPVSKDPPSDSSKSDAPEKSESDE